MTKNFPELVKDLGNPTNPKQGNKKKPTRRSFIVKPDKNKNKNKILKATEKKDGQP